MSIIRKIEDDFGFRRVKTAKKGYGWKKQKPDHRDFIYKPPKLILGPRYNLRPYMPPIIDQGQLGSCTANAIANAFYTEMLRQIWQKTMTYAWLPSRLFIYYNERALEGTISTDSGAEIRDGFKTINTQGVCPEIEWPYNITQFAKRPARQCYVDALKNKSVQYLSLTQDIGTLKTCIASGFPFVFGFNVYDSFESDAVAASGVVPMPNIQTESLLGGHAVLACGYDDYYQAFCVMNSWGTGWGQKGYFFMPYAYLTDTTLASDIWTLRLVN